MTKATTKPQRRIRDVAATRTAILAAARARFAHENYDRVGLREIAADANVDAALIARYFGTKGALLSEVLADALYPSVLMDGDRATFGRRLMSAFADGKPHQLELDYFLLLLRIAMVPALQPVLQSLVRDRLMLPFTAWMGGPDAALRVRLIHTVLTGASMQTLLAGDSSMPPEDTERFRSFFAHVIQDLVDGQSPEGLLGILAHAPPKTLGKGNQAGAAQKAADIDTRPAGKTPQPRARRVAARKSKAGVAITAPDGPPPVA